MSLWESGQRTVDAWRVRQVVWLWKMAWRDSRGGRKRLLLAMAAISVGMAAFIAITAFDANVRDAVHHQAKSLLGADLVLSSRQPFSTRDRSAPALRLVVSSRAKSVVRPWPTFRSPPRLAWCRSEPWRGAFLTMGRWRPNRLQRRLPSGLAMQAVVDDGLLLQFDAQVGDTIKIGTLTLPIAGRLKKIPGEAVAAALIKPRVYMSL